MVGALADWFAVTALFRRPLGLPIPHTAIIPTKKDQLGQSLGSFVGENFLSGDVIRDRIHALGVGRRLGVWLAEPAHADRVTAELATALRGALTVLRDSDVQAVVGEAITRRADAVEVGPGLGKMLEKVVTDGGHRKVVDLVCVRAHDWLVEHGDSVMNAVQGGAPGWTPRFVDKRVGSGSTRSCCGSSRRCGTCRSTRRAARSTRSSPTSRPTSRPTPTPGPGGAPQVGDPGPERGPGRHRLGLVLRPHDDPLGGGGRAQRTAAAGARLADVRWARGWRATNGSRASWTAGWRTRRCTW